MTELTITRTGNMRVGEYEPGNGTRYTAVAVHWYDRSLVSLGALGCIEKGWLVVYGNTGLAYLLQPDGWLTDDYLSEKFGISPGNFPWAGDLLRRLIDREQ